MLLRSRRRGAADVFDTAERRVGKLVRKLTYLVALSRRTSDVRFQGILLKNYLWPTES
jgi:hypothetical protein